MGTQPESGRVGGVEVRPTQRNPDPLQDKNTLILLPHSQE